MLPPAGVHLYREGARRSRQDCALSSSDGSSAPLKNLTELSMTSHARRQTRMTLPWLLWTGIWNPKREPRTHDQVEKSSLPVLRARMHRRLGTATRLKDGWMAVGVPFVSVRISWGRTAGVGEDRQARCPDGGRSSRSRSTGSTWPSWSIGSTPRHDEDQTGHERADQPVHMPVQSVWPADRDRSLIPRMSRNQKHIDTFKAALGPEEKSGQKQGGLWNANLSISTTGVASQHQDGLERDRRGVVQPVANDGLAASGAELLHEPM